MRLLFVVNDAGFFLSHRLPIAIAAREAGYDVHVATIPGAAVNDVVTHGFTHHMVPLTRSGMNLFIELFGFWSIFRLFLRVKPDLVHLVTIKPVLYGGIAARLAGVHGVVTAVSGLGFAFTARGVRVGLVRLLIGGLYKLAFGKKNLRVIFQNPDDRAKLVELGVARPNKSVMIRGSGADLSAYCVVPEPIGVPIVTMASRLLKDKGVCEFVEAARLLNEKGVKAHYWLVGDVDFRNPMSISHSELELWREDGLVELLGYRRDIAEIFAASNLVVLPSYYGEGLPKVLVEASACGRAVVTTDMPGCRDAIEVDVTGVLVPPRDAAALAAAIQRLLEDDDLRRRMGKAGRLLAEREFPIEKIVSAHLDVYQTLMHG